MTEGAATTNRKLAELERVLGDLARLCDECLRRGVTDRRAGQLAVLAEEAILARNQARAGRDGLDRRAVDVREERLAALLFDQTLPGLALMIGATAPGGGSGETEAVKVPPEMDLLAAIRAYRVLSSLQGQLRRGRFVQATNTEQQLQDILTKRAEGLLQQVNGVLDLEEAPDIAEVARLLGQVDILHWCLETLDSKERLDRIGRLYSRAARQAVRRVTEVIDDFIKNRSLEGRIGIAVIASAMDDLYVLAMSVIAGNVAERAGGAHPHVTVIGEEVLSAFVDHLERLVLLLFMELSDNVSGTQKPGVTMDGTLRLMRRLLDLAENLGPQGGGPALQRVATTIRTEMRRFAAELVAETQSGQAQPPGKKARIRKCCEALVVFCQDLDWSDAEKEMTLHRRAIG